jgi:hypothetical protein
MLQTDTPPAEAGRFSLVANYFVPCPGRSSDGTEILHGVGLDLAVDAVRRFGAAVARSVHVPMHPHAAAQTPKPASARRGRLDMPTVTAGLRRIRLVNPLDYHAQLRHLLAEGAGELSVRPLADLLIRLPAQTHCRLRTDQAG